MVTPNDTAASTYLSAAIKLSAILGRKFNVDVSFGGHPRTDGTRIVLPFWDLSTVEKRNALYGCVAHEAGGHVRDTDFSVVVRELIHIKPEETQSTFKSILNIIEDVRIERRLLDQYPGVDYYLGAAAEEFLVSDEPPTDTSSFWSICLTWLLYAVRCEGLGQTMLKGHVEKTGHAIMDAGILTVYQLETLKTIGLSVLDKPAVNSTMGAIGVSKSVFRFLDGLSPQEPPQECQQQPQSGQGGSDDQQQPQGGQGGSDDQQQPQSGQGGSDGQPGAASGERPRATAASCDPSYLEEPMPGIFEKAVQQQVNDAGLQARFSRFKGICATDHQTIQSSALKDVRVWLPVAQKLASRFLPGLTPLLIGDSHEDRRLKSGPRLDARRLCEAMISSDPTVFMRRVVEEDNSVAVGLLVDTSGSTAQTTADRLTIHDHLIQASLGLVKCLESFPEVETMMACFPRPGPEHNRAWTQTVKAFGQPLGPKPRVLAPEGGTPLAQAMLESGFRTMLVPKERAMLFVLTDGQPHEVQRCVEARQILKSIGVEVYGLIISDKADYPTQIFDQSAYVTDVSNLPQQLADMVRKLL